MKELIGADHYYQLKNKRVYFLGGLLAVVIGLQPILVYQEWEAETTILGVFQRWGQMQGVIPLVVMMFTTAFQQGKMFSSRFYMYQVAAKGRTQALLSKYLVQSIWNVLFVIVACSITWTLAFFRCHVENLWDYRVLLLVIGGLALAVRVSVRMVSVVN